MLRFSATIGLACALTLGACDSDQGEFGPSTGVISVHLAWDGPDEFGTAHKFENDLGYVIELSDVMINTYSVELIPCDEDLFRKLQEPRQRPSQSNGLLISKAWAGHGDPTRPTRTGVVRPEWPLEQIGSVFMDTLDPPDYTYCRVHYLVGRVPGNDKTHSDYADLIGVSMNIDGTFQAPGESDSQAFQIRTSAAHGVLQDFGVNVGEDGLRLREGDQLVVHRNFVTLFNGAAFNSMQNRELARQVLRNIVESVSLKIVRNGDEVPGV